MSSLARLADRGESVYHVKFRSNELFEEEPSLCCCFLAFTAEHFTRNHDSESSTPMDRHDLNSEVPAFAGSVPTSENLAREICRRLKAGWSTAFPGPWPKLDRIRIAETDRNIFEMEADEIE